MVWQLARRVGFASFIAGAVMVGLISTEPALGQPSTGGAAAATKSACPPNAALAYWRAWAGRVPAVWDNKFLEGDFKIDPAWQPSAQVAAQLESAQADIEAVLKATKMDTCDWGVPTDEEGYDVVLPHLIKLRTTARVLVADARRLESKGDISGAAERIAALFGMGKHLRSDRLITSVRTGQSFIADFGCIEAQRLAKSGKLDDSARRILVDALTGVSMKDPCDMRGALAYEPALVLTTVKRVCVGPTAAKAFVDKFNRRVKDEERAKSGIDQLDAAGILSSAQRVDTLYKEVLANWDSPDAVKNIRSIDEQRKNGDYGSVAAMLAIDLPHMRVIVFRLENIITETFKAVTGQPTDAAAPPK